MVKIINRSQSTILLADGKKIMPDSICDLDYREYSRVSSIPGIDLLAMPEEEYAGANEDSGGEEPAGAPSEKVKKFKLRRK
jgi:hypothetical protein